MTKVLVLHDYADVAKITEVTNIITTQGYALEIYACSNYNASLAQDADILVVLISTKAKVCRAINDKILNMEQKGKRTIGIWTPNAKESDLSENLKKYAEAVVCWESAKIIGALNGSINTHDAAATCTVREIPPPRVRKC